MNFNNRFGLWTYNEESDEDFIPSSSETDSLEYSSDDWEFFAKKKVQVLNDIVRES